MKRLFRRHPVLASAFALSALAAVFFAGSIIWLGLHWAQQQAEPIRPWMTPRYIERGWGLTLDQLDGVFDTTLPLDGSPTLRQIARELDMTVDELIAKVQSTLGGAAPQAPAAE